MTEYTYGIHWLSFVVKRTKEDAFMLYDLFFKELFGGLQSIGHGGRGYDEIWHSLFEFKVYVSPRSGEIEHFHFEIPGQACEFIPWDIFKGLDILLQSNYASDYHYTRLDLAFDHLDFTPQDVEDAISENKVRSLAKRETLIVHKSPFEKRDNGELGTHTVDFGSRQSERMIRVYNRRGFTRFEMELKKRRADLVVKQIFSVENVSEWYPIAISHLRDYVDFDTKWWNEFVNGIGRADATISNPKEVSLERIAKWLKHQVAPALSVMSDIQEDDFLSDLIQTGRTKRRGIPKYDLLLASEQDVK